MPVIEHDGDRWRVLATGASDASGRVYCHLASTTRAVKQRNGANPVQIADWVQLEPRESERNSLAHADGAR